MSKIAIAYQQRQHLIDYLSTRRGFIWQHARTSSGKYYELLAFEPKWTLTDCSPQQLEMINRLFRAKQGPKKAADEFFNGGLAGYIGYDYSRRQAHHGFDRCRPVPLHSMDSELADGNQSLPADLWLAYFPTNYLTVDHQLQRISGDIADSNTLNAILLALKTNDNPDASTGDPCISGNSNRSFQLLSEFSPKWTSTQYQQAYQRIKAYILAGDCYQVNLTQQLTATYKGDTYSLFRRIIEKHRTPHFAYLKTGQGDILSFSPESFLSIENGHICTQPIKGTRQRHPDPSIDQIVANDLLNSAKDRAENIMIVDLLRNDLGHLAKTGSVKVKQLCELKTFSNVHHLVSHICAELRDDISPLQALLACSPGGSITGAPKIRAMEIIDELEDFPRNIYCGSVFLYGHNGRLESNIAIRTIACYKGQASIWGGGGIVADSVDADEYKESLFKIKHLLDELTKTLAS